MQSALLGVTHASQNDPLHVVRDSSVLGYIYVAEVDETRKKVRLLVPLSERVPARAMLLGNWPEEIPDLLS